MGLAATHKRDETNMDDAENPGRSNHAGVGTDIRALRKSRSLTLAEFAETLNRSIGFMSQIERGISEPSIEDLRNIANLFEVPLSFFFGNLANGNAGSQHIVRADARRRIGNPDAGLIEELLSPDLGGTFEIIRSEFAPGAELPDAQQRHTEEAGYIVSGELELELDGVWHTLRTGDSFRFSGQTYRWRNRSDIPAIAIWVISPPVY